MLENIIEIIIGCVRDVLVSIVGRRIEALLARLLKRRRAEPDEMPPEGP